jgi:hypothetical protein
MNSYLAFILGMATMALVCYIFIRYYIKKIEKQIKGAFSNG